MQNNLIEWIYPKKNNRIQGGDVQVSAWKRKNSNEEMYVSISNEAAKRIGSDRIAYGRNGNRMYFLPTGSGFKLSQSSKNRKSFKAVGIDHSLTVFIGQHELIYDERERLYYIQVRS